MRGKSFEERARAEVERIKAEERQEGERFQARLEELRTEAAKRRTLEADQKARAFQRGVSRI